MTVQVVGGTQTSPPPPPVESPTPVMLVGGVFPLYIMDEVKQLDKLVEDGVTCCFILARTKYTTTNNQTSHRPSLYRFLKTDWGISLAEVSFDVLGAKAVLAPEAEFLLPKMSYEFVEKLDKFFRAAHAKYDTESIVLLTFDKTKIATKDSSGWGFFVPTQKNTGGDCDYELAEVVAYIEDHTDDLMLAGSAHSHPEMSAFFSGTDHTDQADFEGLHITFGWPRGSNISEYHIEIVLNGMRWERKPHEVFEEPPRPEVELANLDLLMEKVSKKAPPPSKSFTGHTSGGGTNYGGTYSPSNHKGPRPIEAVVVLPSNAPPASTNTIVACIDESETDCPFCSVPVTANFMKHRRCYRCSSFISVGGETLGGIIAQREAESLEIPEWLDPKKAEKPIWFWTRTWDPVAKSFTHDFACILEVDNEGKQTEKKA